MKSLALALLLCASTASAATYYASPSGSGSACTLAAPCSLAKGLDGSVVHAGDTLYLRGGTYNGTQLSSLAGTSSSQITVRSYTGEWAKIDGGNSNGAGIFQIMGSYTTYRDLEIMSSNTDRDTNDSGSWPPGSEIPRGEGFQINQSAGHPGIKIINNVVHDTRQGISWWLQATNGEISGNIFYYNGWNAPDRGHGHGIYMQTPESGSTTLVKNNISIYNFDHGIQAYGSAPWVNNITFDGNTLVRSGAIGANGPNHNGRNLLVGVDSHPVTNTTVQNNYLYYPSGTSPDTALNMGYGGGCTNVIITNNYFAQNNFFSGCTPSTMTGNTFYGNAGSEFVGLSEGSFPSNTYRHGVRPVGNSVFIRKNDNEAGRANVTIYNWAGSSNVTVDLTSVLANGDSYEIKNGANYLGPAVKTGVYGGDGVDFPMSGLVNATPIGTTGPTVSGPEFNVFVVKILGSGGATPTPTAVGPTVTPTKTTTPAPPTMTPTKTPTPIPGASSYFEAETATLAAPMAAASDPLASNGQYISSNTAEQGKATYTIVAIAPNVAHYLWHRVLCPNYDSDSLYVSLDGESDAARIDDACEGVAGPSWQWRRVADRSIGGVKGATWTRVLSGGTHSLAFRGRESGPTGMRLDRLAITTDINFVPSDSTPTPTAIPPSPTPTKTPTPATVCFTVTPGG